jgi:hypothetical protein
MRIVDRKTFMDMPEGTVFSEIEERWAVGELSVKVENLGTVDFYEPNFTWVDADDSNIAIERLEEMWEDETVSYPVDSAIGRNGLFNYDAKYLVYEPEDVQYIVNTLTKGLKP